MKTAMIIIPQACKTVNIGMYLSSCADKVKKDGYTVLHSTFWNEYRDIDFNELIKKSVRSIDTFYFFVDYGITDIMIKLLKRIKKTRNYKRIKDRFKKEVKIELLPMENGFSLEFILEDISNKTNIPVELMKLKTRGRPIVESRQIYFKRAREVTKFSLYTIGLLVNRDHSTVMYGIRTVNNVRELTRKYNELFNGNN